MRRREHKERITVTIDPELVVTANEAVRAGRADSLSGWVNLALVERAEKERRLRALEDAVAAYEAEFGTITSAEMAAQRRADERAAVVVRGVRRIGARRVGGRGGAA
jgi:glycerol dehydrogenase-like iron-containing ADH family enzyme